MIGPLDPGLLNALLGQKKTAVSTNVDILPGAPTITTSAPALPTGGVHTGTPPGPVDPPGDSNLTDTNGAKNSQKCKKVPF